LLDTINVKIGEYYVTNNPHILVSLGLGSCVAIVLYDPMAKVGGLAHTALATSTGNQAKGNPGKFVDTAVDVMVKEMINLGANKKRIIAKIVGGACMFSPAGKNASPIMEIGNRNVAAAKSKLEAEGISLVGEDTGGDYGRSLKFLTSSGKVAVKSIRYGEKEL